MSSQISKDALSVSVVIPAYRASGTICRAIDSVLDQTHQPLEILVIDDESPDDLAPVLRRYGTRVTYVRQPHGGAAAARNRGIGLARGDLVAFLDADDWWMPDKLERYVIVFQEHANVGLAASRYIIQDTEGTTARTAGNEERCCDRVIRARGADALKLARNITTPTVVARRHLLIEHRFDETLSTAEDRDLWIRLLMATEVFFLATSLTTVVVSPGSLSHARIDVDCTCMLRVIRRYTRFIGAIASRREQSYVYYQWSTGRGRGWTAFAHLARSLWLWPFPYSGGRTRRRLARLRLFTFLIVRSLLPGRLARGLQWIRSNILGRLGSLARRGFPDPAANTGL